MNNDLPRELSEFLQATPDIIVKIQWKIELIDWFYIGAFVIYSLLICLILVRLYQRTERKEIKSKKPDDKIIYNTDVCPICLNALERPVRISCGHAYCACCIIRYFEYIMKKGRCECPMCKATIRDANLLNSGTTLYIGDANDILQLKIKKLLEKAKIGCLKRKLARVARNLLLVYVLLQEHGVEEVPLE